MVRRGLFEGGFDGGDDFGGVGGGGGFEAGDGLAVAGDEELGEVPLDVAADVGWRLR